MTSLIVLSMVLLGCSAANKVKDAEELRTLHELMASKAFRFKAQTANPMATRSMNAVANSGLIQPGSTVNRIDIIGIDNYLVIKGDSVMADLPYYGERQIAGAYNSTQIGILFNGIPNRFQMEFIDKRKAYEILFNISNRTEVYDVTMVVFPNKNTSVHINSSQRLTISYHGAISALKETD